jgi:hypothetical protein
VAWYSAWLNAGNTNVFGESATSEGAATLVMSTHAVESAAKSTNDNTDTNETTRRAEITQTP